MREKRICLNMIVRNETPVLGRLFASIKNIISYYVIVDTGSTDGTLEFINQWMKQAGIPGEVHCHEWINFGHNRNQALQYAYQCGLADWVLMIDADEELVYSDPFIFSKLEPGVSYSLEKRHGAIRYRLNNLVDITQTRWQWHGVVHEYLDYVDGSRLRKALSEAWIISHDGEGVRSRGIYIENKFLRDAALLEAQLIKYPDDSRSLFYLAQSYQDAGHIEEAYKNYLLRADMPGWAEENFVAQYRAGKMAILLDKPYNQIVALFLKAYEIRPCRGAEPLHELARYCRNRSWYAQAYLFSKTGSEIGYPNDILFVENEVYQWRIFDELAIAAYWTGRYQESRDVCEKMLKIQSIPKSDKERINKNLEFALSKVNQ